MLASLVPNISTYPHPGRFATDVLPIKERDCGHSASLWETVGSDEPKVRPYAAPHNWGWQDFSVDVAQTTRSLIVAVVFGQIKISRFHHITVMK